jgi:hypothetical protein
MMHGPANVKFKIRGEDYSKRYGTKYVTKTVPDKLNDQI